MNKKNYLIIGVTILVFTIIIVTILITGNKNKNNWTTNISKAQNYEIKMIDCNGREKTLEKDILTSIEKKTKNLSNNGPWTGDSSICYTTVNFSYENNGIVNQIQLLIIDNTSLVLDLGNSTTYYTNGTEVINYLNDLFKN